MGLATRQGVSTLSPEESKGDWLGGWQDDSEGLKQERRDVQRGGGLHSGYLSDHDVALCYSRTPASRMVRLTGLEPTGGARDSGSTI